MEMHMGRVQAPCCMEMYKMAGDTSGDSALREPAQSKCTWTFHKSNFVWKSTRKMPDPNATTSIEHRALTLTVRTPQCGHTVWGNICLSTVHNFSPDTSRTTPSNHTVDRTPSPLQRNLWPPKELRSCRRIRWFVDDPRPADPLAPAAPYEEEPLPRAGHCDPKLVKANVLDGSCSAMPYAPWILFQKCL